MDVNIVKKESKIKSILWIALGDILQVSPDTDSLISNGYHNNLRGSLSCDFLPVSELQTIYQAL